MQSECVRACEPVHTRVSERTRELEGETEVVSPDRRPLPSGPLACQHGPCREIYIFAQLKHIVGRGNGFISLTGKSLRGS